MLLAAVAVVMVVLVLIVVVALHFVVVMISSGQEPKLPDLDILKHYAHVEHYDF